MKIINNQNPKKIQVEMTEAELVFLRWLTGQTTGTEEFSNSIYNATRDYASESLKEYNCSPIQCEEVEQFIEKIFIS